MPRSRGRGGRGRGRGGRARSVSRNRSVSRTRSKSTERPERPVRLSAVAEVDNGEVVVKTMDDSRKTSKFMSTFVVPGKVGVLTVEFKIPKSNEEYIQVAKRTDIEVLDPSEVAPTLQSLVLAGMFQITSTGAVKCPPKEEIQANASGDTHKVTPRVLTAK